MCHPRMLQPQVLFPDRQRTLEEGLRFRVLTLISVEDCRLLELLIWTFSFDLPTSSFKTSCT